MHLFLAKVGQSLVDTYFSIFPRSFHMSPTVDFGTPWMSPTSRWDFPSFKSSIIFSFCSSVLTRRFLLYSHLHTTYETIVTSAHVGIKWPACYNNCPVDRGARNFDDRISEVPLYYLLRVKVRRLASGLIWWLHVLYWHFWAYF